ncbi:MAG: exodeoxyribonuclease VII small subunit [Bacillota bacterium]|nr:exodeoxyribonuclease VII small subunit [Bacillota bacterium]
MVKKAESYEEMLKKLEEIVQKIDDSNVPLEESMKKFEQGVVLCNNMYKKLSQAEEKVKILIDNKEEVYEENE